LAVRIYSLAKELSVDSKDLVDICTRAGVTGKGSALASLSDDEVTKVKDFMSNKSGGGTATATSPLAPPPMERPRGDKGSGRMRVIVPKKAPEPTPPPKPPEAEEAPPEEAAA